VDLKNKLNRLARPPTSGVAAGTTATVVEESPAASSDRSLRLSQLKARLAEMAATGPKTEPRIYRRGPAAVLRRLPGGDEPTACGPVRVAALRRSLDYRHGVVPIEPARGADARTLAALAMDPGLAALDPQRLLYLDTETTGLAGGTGTLAFLVGLGWFAGSEFVVEQLLLTRPGDERPLLTRLVERLATASGIVTFNGRAFDWPLLRTRFIMNRLPAPTPLHLDLLHVVRRVYRQRLLSLRLKAIETEVLKLEREDDIDGSQIPPIYWEFQRSGDGALLEPILEHNVHDILALPAILGLVAQGFAGDSVDLDPRDALGFARLAARHGDVNRALGFVELAATGADEVVVGALRLRAVIEVRRRAYPAAVAALATALFHVRRDGEAAATLHLGLAKLFEHRIHDLNEALAHAAHTTGAEGALAQAKRVRRLTRRRDRKVRPSSSA
jgi:uncharacterized protein